MSMRRYTLSMDTVRFGRALGIGARSTAKALLAAAEAAATPKPGSAGPPPTATRPVIKSVERLRDTQAGLARGSRRFGQAVWTPFVRLGGVLWLELTGVFFGLFVLFAASNAWKLRAHLRQTGTNHIEHQHLLWSLAMATLFAYFCVSSFLRASRRSRNR